MNSAGFSVSPFGDRLKSGRRCATQSNERFQFDSFVRSDAETPFGYFSASESMLCYPIAGKVRRFITVARETLCKPAPERHFPPNRKTALCHTVRRNMAGPASASARGRAREDIPTHRPTRKENVSLLNGPVSQLEGERSLLPWECGFESRQVHSGDCGFPFALTFLGEGLTPCSPSNPRLSHQTFYWPHGNDSSSLGAVSVSSALFFLLGFRYPRLVSLNS